MLRKKRQSAEPPDLQPRKRLDLTLKYFAEFAKNKPDNVKLYYHGALNDMGWDVLQLATYLGIEQRLIITSPNLTAANGVTKETLKFIYNSFDVQVSTTLGEGWGLTQSEGMSCKVPQIVPDWSALAEWCRFEDGASGVAFIPCTATSVNTGGINTIGGVAAERLFVEKLNELYTDKNQRALIAEAGYKIVSQPKYSWDTVASNFNDEFMAVLNERSSKN